MDKDNTYELVDIPSTYSLILYSDEEEATRNFLCFDNYNMAIVACGSLCLERNFI